MEMWSWMWKNKSYESSDKQDNIDVVELGIEVKMRQTHRKAWF